MLVMIMQFTLAKYVKILKFNAFKVRDFTKMMKNKVKRGRSRIGYLPVEGQYEGPVFEQVRQHLKSERAFVFALFY